MDIGCHPCGIIEVISNPQEVETIATSSVA